MIGSTDWAGLAGFIIAVATLIPVLVTAFLQITQNKKISETHTAVTPVNGEPTMVSQVTETNTIAKDAQQTLNDVAQTATDIKHVVENGNNTTQSKGN